MSETPATVTESEDSSDPIPVDDSEDPVEDDDCTASDPDCTCVIEPRVPEDACWHGNGGRYSDGACSSTQQCCEGSWTDLESCGACACTQSTGSEGCVPETDGQEICFPRFTSQIDPLPSGLRDQMLNVSWEEGCPVELDDLSRIQMSHWGFDEQLHVGELIVATDVAELVQEAFEHAYKWRFAIERMEPVSLYGGSDDASMAANNTSAFNCRAVTGGSSWSQHSYGNAIDINPIQNPYVAGSVILPPEGEDYLERDSSVSGLIYAPGPVTGAFLRKGWGWGGNWNSLKDYQHFSENGQ